MNKIWKIERHNLVYGWNARGCQTKDNVGCLANSGVVHYSKRNKSSDFFLYIGNELKTIQELFSWEQ